MFGADPLHSQDSAKNCAVEVEPAGSSPGRQAAGYTRKPLPVNEPKPVLPVNKQLKMVAGGGGGQSMMRTEVIEEENSSEGGREERGEAKGELEEARSQPVHSGKRKLTPMSPRVGPNTTFFILLLLGKSPETAIYIND